MVSHRERTIGLMDFVKGCRGIDPQQFVVVHFLSLACVESTRPVRFVDGKFAGKRQVHSLAGQRNQTGLTRRITDIELRAGQNRTAQRRRYFQQFVQSDAAAIGSESAMRASLALPQESLLALMN